MFRDEAPTRPGVHRTRDVSEWPKDPAELQGAMLVELVGMGRRLETIERNQKRRRSSARWQTALLSALITLSQVAQVVWLQPKHVDAVGEQRAR